MVTAASYCSLCSFTLGSTVAPAHARAEASRSASRQSVRLEVTRDTWVSDVGQEADGNNGGAPRLKLKSIQEMTLVDIDASRSGPDDPVGGAAPEESRRRAAPAGDGQQRRGRVVRGDRQQLRGPARRRDVPPSPASRPPLVDRRGRPLPRDPGQRRHDLADGRRLAARSRRLAARAGRPAGRGGPRGRAQLWLPGLRRHRLGMDPHAARRSRFRIFPNRFVYSRDQNRASAPYFTIELGPEDRQPPAAPSGLRSSRGRRSCRPARRWSRGSRPATTARPARSASS